MLTVNLRKDGRCERKWKKRTILYLVEIKGFCLTFSEVNRYGDWVYYENNFYNYSKLGNNVRIQIQR